MKLMGGALENKATALHLLPAAANDCIVNATARVCVREHVKGFSTRV